MTDASGSRGRLAEMSEDKKTPAREASLSPTEMIALDLTLDRVAEIRDKANDLRREALELAGAGDAILRDTLEALGELGELEAIAPLGELAIGVDKTARRMVVYRRQDLEG